MNIFALYLIIIINVSRADVHMPPVVESKALDAIAQQRANSMCGGDVSHAGFYSMDLRKTPWLIMGENIASGFGANPQLINNAWLASPTHKANEINVIFNEIGVGKCGQVTVVELGRERNLVK